MKTEKLGPKNDGAKYLGAESTEKLKKKGLGLTVVVDTSVDFLFEETLKGFVAEAKKSGINEQV